MRGGVWIAVAAGVFTALVAVVAVLAGGEPDDGAAAPAGESARRGAAVALDPGTITLVSPDGPTDAGPDGTVEVSGLLRRALPPDHELWVVTRREPSGGVRSGAPLGKVTVGAACDVVGGEFSCGSVPVGGRAAHGRFLLDVLVADPAAAAGLGMLAKAQRDGGTGPRELPGSVAALPPVRITR